MPSGSDIFLVTNSEHPLNVEQVSISYESLPVSYSKASSFEINNYIA